MPSLTSDEDGEKPCRWSVKEMTMHPAFHSKTLMQVDVNQADKINKPSSKTHTRSPKTLKTAIKQVINKGYSIWTTVITTIFFMCSIEDLGRKQKQKVTG